MSKQPLVSIIIPTFNRAHLIGETLDSVLAQTYTNWECIVVDDGSTDATAELLKGYCEKDSRFQYHHRPENRLGGGNASRNYGFEVSEGEIINWIDSDDLILPEHLTTHVKSHFDIDEIIDCIITNAEVFEESKHNIIRYWSNIKVREDVIKEMISQEVLWQTGCVSWKRNSIKQRPFNENLASSQEWTFHLNQLINNIKYKILEKTTYLARSHSDRIGKMVSRRKINSTFLSRIIIFDALREANMLNKEREHIILQNVVRNLYRSIQLNYYSSYNKITIGLLKRFSFFYYKKYILLIVFFASPFFKITGKGYRFFNISKKDGLSSKLY